MRIARPARSRPAAAAGVPVAPSRPVPVVASPPAEVRANSGATRRAVRLSLLYAVGIGAVYAGLVGLARSSTSGASAGGTAELGWVGLLALAVAAAGVVVALGAVPRAVELGEEATIVVGRFGRRYRYPGRAHLRTTVLQRSPAGVLSPVTLESVEIAGGTARRSFLLDERLLEPVNGPAA